MQLSNVDNITSLQQSLVEVARQGKRVALVPTMGALHSGHMELVKVAKEKADFVVVSIFVNPRQFGPKEDFANYPRTLDADMQKLAAAGASLVYTPTNEDMYPAGFTTTVSPGDMGNILCGKFRPGHFDGVATVVSKLLLRVLPHVAVFGEKDYQQLCIIRQVAYDLDIPMDIVGVPVVREADGLAMSSRNVYLTPQERANAPKFYQALLNAKKLIVEQKMEAAMATAVAGTQLTQAGFKVDYLELVDADTLEALGGFNPPCRLLGAVWLGKTRLIDNVEC